MEKIPSFVRGNTTVIAVRPQWEDMDAQGEKTLTDADLTKVKDMAVTVVSMFGKRYEMAWKLIDSKTFQIDLVDLPVGNYGIEVRCTDADGMRRRYYAAPNEFVRIVSPSSEAYIPTDGTVNKMFDMTITFSLVGAVGDALARAEASVKAADDALGKASEALDKAENLSGKANSALALANEAKATADGQAKTLTDTNAAIVGAERARVAAEEGRVNAENARTAAEAARATAEGNRDNAETARQTAETARATAENERSEAEQGRKDAENERTTAETERAKAEHGRTSTESERATAEASRAEAEAKRATAEAERLNAEQARKEAEQARADAESKRETFIDSAKTTVDEASKVDAQLDGTKISVTNRKGEVKSLELVDIDEHVTVTIKSEVDGLDASNVAITVYRNHGEVPESYTTGTEGKVTFSVTRGTYYEVHFPEKAGAQLISPIGYTATLPVRSIEATYLSDGDGAMEAVTIETKKVNTDNSKDVFPNVSITVQIGSGEAKTLTTDAEGKATFSVPIGKSYKVVFPEQAGYFLFFERSYTKELVADSLTRTIRFYYSAYKMGVYILTQDGNEYLLDDFKAKGLDVSSAKMIVVYERNLMLNSGVIYASIDDLAKQDFPKLMFCEKNVKFNGVPSDGIATNSQYYYDGNSATNAILQDAVGRFLKVPAFTYAHSRTITIGGKVLTGYLPSIGQFNVLKYNATAVDDILKYVVGDSTKTMSDYFSVGKWTSAQKGDAGQAYYFYSTASPNYQSYEFGAACFFAY